MKAFTPIVGGSIGLALGCVGVGVLIWGKKLLPHEIAIQGRHDGGSPPDERKITAETLKFVGSEMGLARPAAAEALAAGPGAASVRSRWWCRSAC